LELVLNFTKTYSEPIAIAWIFSLLAF
jgi:hypothetical protein